MYRHIGECLGDALKDVQVSSQYGNGRENLSPLKKAKMAINGIDNIQKNKYSTRSVARERMKSPLSVRNERLKNSTESNENVLKFDTENQEEDNPRSPQAAQNNPSKKGKGADVLEREERKKMLEMLERMRWLDDSIVELETANSYDAKT